MLAKCYKYVTLHKSLKYYKDWTHLRQEITFFLSGFQHFTFIQPQESNICRWGHVKSDLNVIYLKYKSNFHLKVIWVMLQPRIMTNFLFFTSSFENFIFTFILITPFLISKVQLWRIFSFFQDIFLIWHNFYIKLITFWNFWQVSKWQNIIKNQIFELH